MKDIKTWRKEVDKALAEKVSEFSKAFEAQRNRDFEDLSNFSEQLEVFEKKKKDLLATQGAEAKNFIPSNSILNECGQKLHYMERNIEGFQKQIDGLFKKLTNFPESIKEIYPFMKLIQG